MYRRRYVAPVLCGAGVSPAVVRASCPHRNQEGTIMTQSTQRTIFRWIHIVFSIPILGYIYSPFDRLPDYAGPTRFLFLPVMVLTGLWMWKGHVVRRLFSRKPA